MYDPYESRHKKKHFAEGFYRGLGIGFGLLAVFLAAMIGLILVNS